MSRAGSRPGYLTGPLFGRYRCRHKTPGGCPRCLFPDDAPPPTPAQLKMASEDVWTPQEPIRRLTRSEE